VTLLIIPEADKHGPGVVSCAGDEGAAATSDPGRAGARARQLSISLDRGTPASRAIIKHQQAGRGGHGRPVLSGRRPALRVDAAIGPADEATLARHFMLWGQLADTSSARRESAVLRGR